MSDWADDLRHPDAQDQRRPLDDPTDLEVERRAAPAAPASPEPAGSEADRLEQAVEVPPGDEDHDAP